LPEPDGDTIRRRVRIVARTPSLRGAETGNTAHSEGLIAEALAAGGVPALEARAAAAAAMAAMTAALFEWALQDELTLAEAVHKVLDVLEAR
jgi:hypothetical protein